MCEQHTQLLYISFRTVHILAKLLHKPFISDLQIAEQIYLPLRKGVINSRITEICLAISAHFRHVCDFIGAQCPVLKSCDYLLCIQAQHYIHKVTWLGKCTFVMHMVNSPIHHNAQHSHVHTTCRQSRSPYMQNKV